MNLPTAAPHGPFVTFDRCHGPTRLQEPDPIFNFLRDPAGKLQPGVIVCLVAREDMYAGLVLLLGEHGLSSAGGLRAFDGWTVELHPDLFLLPSRP